VPVTVNVPEESAAKAPDAIDNSTTVKQPASIFFIFFSSFLLTSAGESRKEGEKIQSEEKNSARGLAAFGEYLGTAFPYFTFWRLGL
jgi:hypothetical protein